MKISLNELKKYVNIKVSTEELLRLIGSRLVEIEGTINLSEKYKNIKIIKVAECEKISGTHLSLCQIDAGEKNLIQVVCGAPNVHRGMLAVWLAPGVIVPSTFGNENFKLGAKKLRGFDSNGMLAAADELDLWEDHEGILEINPKDAKPGDDFAEVFGLNDTILDIENKSLTHRPDCFGIIGFAREVAGILGEKFVEPEFLYKETVFPEGFLEVDKNENITSKNCPIDIQISDTELCPRYSCAVLEIDKNSLENSKYLQKSDIFLYKAGMRPVSKIVDLTNILMLETGQPLHAFDYDKFVAVGKSKNPCIIVRAAKDGEELKLLDDKIIKCSPNDILITSNNIPVALAGAMGGENTEIDASTHKIILESATFSLYNLRKTQMAHGIFSEAITRFTKGQPASHTFNVLAEAVTRLGGEAIAVKDFYPVTQKANTVKIKISDINLLLGTKYTCDTAFNALRNVGFEVVEHAGTDFDVIAPCWRTDIHIKEDIIEEVGRLLGFDNIELSLPSRHFVGATIDPILSFKSRLRNILSDKLSMNEVLTYSFVSEDLIKKVGADPADAYKIVNSISPELQNFRMSLIPSLIDKVRENQRAGFSDFYLYEFNQITKKSLGMTSENVPEIRTNLTIVALDDYYGLKNSLTELFSTLGFTDFEVKEFTGKDYLYEPAHSADMVVGDQIIAHFGEVKNSVLRNFKLSAPISAFEIDLEILLNLPKDSHKSFTISKFPSVSRDITLKTDNKISFSKVADNISKTLSCCDLLFEVSPVSIYKSEKNLKTRNISFHLSFSNPNKTLSSDEISDIMKQITNNLSALGVEAV